MTPPNMSRVGYVPEDSGTLADTIAVIEEKIRQNVKIRSLRVRLKAEMLTEPKRDLMRQLTGCLWSKSSSDLIDMLFAELSSEELRSLSESYGVEGE